MVGACDPIDPPDRRVSSSNIDDAENIGLLTAEEEIRVILGAHESYGRGPRRIVGEVVTEQVGDVLVVTPVDGGPAEWRDTTVIVGAAYVWHRRPMGEVRRDGRGCHVTRFQRNWEDSGSSRHMR